MSLSSSDTPQISGVMVVFGADGDLTKRKLLPSLYNLAAGRYLSEGFVVVGLARTAMTTEEFRQKLGREIREYATTTVDAGVWEWLQQRLYYVTGDFNDPQSYQRLQDMLKQVGSIHHTCGNNLYYLATAPSFFGLIIRHLSMQGLTAQAPGTWQRVIIEKPFGHDLESAKSLNRELRQYLEENQIYRIDHYLGKETVQNILVFRFGNGIFEPIWNRRYIDHVQITVAESLGVEHRGNYYDQAGALRDMVPNHLLQLLSVIAMEPPNSFDANAVRDEKTKLLRAILPLHSIEVLRSVVAAQYDEGIIDGKPEPAYRPLPIIRRAQDIVQVLRIGVTE